MATEQLINTTLSFLQPYLTTINSNKSKNYVNKPLIIGISGPQASDKTSLSTTLVQQLTIKKFNTIEFSLDDFTLGYLDLLKLEDKYPNDKKKLVKRGLPGTHDLKFLKTILEKINSWNDSYNTDKELLIPRYNTKAYNGKGDRLPVSQWSKIYKTLPKQPLDVVIITGKILGFKSLNVDTLINFYDDASHDNQSIVNKLNLKPSDLMLLNDSLKPYDEIWNFIDLFIDLNPIKLNYIYNWKLSQKYTKQFQPQQQINEEDDGNDEKVISKINDFLPLYELYYPRLIKFGIVKEKGKNLILNLNEDKEIENGFLTENRQWHL